MARSDESAIELIVPDWPAPPRVRAAATTRAGGVSIGSYRSLNLAGHVGDDPAALRENRRRLVRDLGLPAEPRWLNQVHGASVADAAQPAATPLADAMTASGSGQVCAVLTADCLPVLFCAADGAYVAVAHAGWRGLAAGVLEATVAALARGGVVAVNLLAWLGPAISGPAYEVGSEVRQAFTAPGADAVMGFTPNPRGRWQLDLAALARQRLAAAGVKRVWGGNFCTHGDPERFFSYRRDGSCGRQATMIWLQD